MSSKTRARKTRTTADTTGSRLRSVPDQAVAAKFRTDAEDKLWEALHATPNSTAADLATAAKIGKSTAQKILVKWATEGSVTRTGGIAEGGRRAADMWAVTEADDTQTDQPNPADTAAAEDADTTNTTQAEPVAPDTPDDADVTVVEEDRVKQTDTTAAPTQDLADPDEANPDLVEAEPVVAEVQYPAADDAATAKDGADATGERVTRLAPGALRGMVEDHLRDHPGEQFGPTAIANALGGKSSGAVSNALDKMVEDGVVTKTQDKPKRFAIASSE